MNVLIYESSKTVMQSTYTKSWIMVFSSELGSHMEKTMKWSATKNTLGQVSMHFNTLEEALEFAKIHYLGYEIIKEFKQEEKGKSYQFNFEKNRNLYYY